MSFTNKYPQEEPVVIKNLLCVAETEKCYAVLPFSTIQKLTNPAAVESIKTARSMYDNYVVWLPKSQITKCDFSPCDILPAIKENYSSKINSSIIVYKTQMEITIAPWIARDKNLIASESSESTQEEDSNAGW